MNVGVVDFQVVIP